MEKNRVWKYCGLSLLTGALLWAAWPPFPTGYIAFFAFIPLFYILDKVFETSAKPGKRSFLYAYLACVAWNAFTTWWIWYASGAGAVMAILLNALMMALVIWLAYRVRRFSGSRLLWYISLVVLWIGYEHIHYNWDAPWPWLTLGNIFASLPNIVQWYEYTGVQGGTLWIWIMNILLYEAFRNLGYFSSNTVRKRYALVQIFVSVFICICLVACSYVISFAQVVFKPAKPPGNVVVVQPNIDPYTEKFTGGTLSSQIETLISLSEQKIDAKTKLVVWPETAVAEEVFEDHLHFTPSFMMVDTFLKRHPQVKLITGTTSITTYRLDQKPSATARMFGDKSGYYDEFNAAILLDTGKKFEVYHKSKLVPGVEKMPYPAIFGILEPLAINLGGSSGSLGSQDSAEVFRIDSQIVAAPVICYESIFGDYIGDYINKGANMITIITNDGWWDNSPGYRQHQEYAVLRAIETRKFIARSANTGISCFIHPDGTITQRTGWWVPAVIKENIILRSGETFYVKHGDYIAYALKYAGYILLLYAFFGGLIKRLRRGKRQIETDIETGM